MGLSTQGYDIIEATNGKNGLAMLSEKPDVIILDLGLPDIPGLELLSMLRDRNERVPIVVLSSRGDETAKVEGARPWRRRLRDEAVRHGGASGAPASGGAPSASRCRASGPYSGVGDLSIDLVRRIVKVGDKEVKLSPKEYDLLRLLVQHAGRC